MTTTETYRECPQRSVLNIKGEHFACDAMRGMHESSPTHDGWPHSNRDAEAVWGGDQPWLRQM